MGQFVSVAGRWNAPNFLYPGSIIKFYNFGRNGDLVIRYGNPKSGYKEDKLNIKKTRRRDTIRNSNSRKFWRKF